MRHSPWTLPRQPVSGHIHEIRRRLILVLAVLIAGTATGYALRDPLLIWLTAPLGQPLYYTSPGGGLTLVLQIALTVGVILTIPVALFHVIQFVSPTLPPRSRLWLWSVIASSCLLALAGMAAAILISLPTALRFLEDFSGPRVLPLISTDRYFSFVLLYVGGFALLFQLPLLLVLANQVTPLSTRTLFARQRWVILTSFVAAALLTPTPDPMNQALLAIPMIGLYHVGVVSVWLANRPSKRDQFADGITRGALHALKNRQLVESWYADHQGSQRLHCRWKGYHGGQERELITVVLDNRHHLVDS